MTTDDEQPASLGLVLGFTIPSYSSSSSSSEDNTQDAHEANQQEQEQQTTKPTSIPVATITTRTNRSNSVANDDLTNGRSIIYHVDLEHGGEACGVLHLSVVAYDPSAEAKIVGEFDECIKPPAKLNAVWSDHASDVHGTYPTDARITSAPGIAEVWKRFVTFIEGHLGNLRNRG